MSLNTILENICEKQNYTVESEQFSLDHSILPEDRSLAVNNLEQIPLQYLEIWYRLYHHGIINQGGAHCIFMAYFLKRLMRLHGFSANVKQVIATYENPNKKWKYTVGAPDKKLSPRPGIDTHAVVVSNGLILDFAQTPIKETFGSLAPKGFIVEEKYNQWIDLGWWGRVRYTQRNDHAETKNERILIKDDVIKLAKEYFKIYRA
jgi:hypothetical protein